jgi:hypothetical protein
MFHSRRSSGDTSPIIVPPRVNTVRLLRTHEELQAAVERARAFERRGVDAGHRRVGAYDRFLDEGRGEDLDNVLPMESLRGSGGQMDAAFDSEGLAFNEACDQPNHTQSAMRVRSGY